MTSLKVTLLRLFVTWSMLGEDERDFRFFSQLCDLNKSDLIKTVQFLSKSVWFKMTLYFFKVDGTLRMFDHKCLCSKWMSAICSCYVVWWPAWVLFSRWGHYFWLSYAYLKTFFFPNTNSCIIHQPFPLSLVGSHYTQRAIVSDFQAEEIGSDHCSLGGPHTTMKSSVRCL